MKKIICKKEYDTENAELLKKHTEGVFGEPDDIQLQMSTAREFMFAYRVSNATEQSFAELNRLEKQINEQGFDCKRAGKEDIKRLSKDKAEEWLAKH